MLADDQFLEIDRICDQFERNWNLDAIQVIGNLVAEFRADGQLELLKQLIHVDLDLRIRNRQPHDLDLYNSAFPQFRSSLGLIHEQYFVSAGMSTVESESPHVHFDSQVTVEHNSNQVGRAPSSQPRQSSHDRYQILKRHAKGGLGEVFIARDTELNRKVALKEILERSAGDKESIARFLREAEVTGNLEHPGIVPVYGMGHYADGRPFYAMRFIEGESLEDALRKFHQSNVAGKSANFTQHSLEFRQLLGRFVSVCYAIEFAHSRGVLHRDIKPSNIMLGKYGETLVVDWGLAKVQGQIDVPSSVDDEQLHSIQSGSGSSNTKLGTVIGTPAYMSPEQAMGTLDFLGPATDIYSLGATLYSLLVGDSPFGNKKAKSSHELLELVRHGGFDRPRERNPNLPLALEAICNKAMCVSPEGRYPSALTLANEIELWLADESVTAMPDSTTDKVLRFARKNRRLMQTGVVALVCIAVLASISAVLVNSSRKAALELAKKNKNLADEKATLASEKSALANAESGAREQAEKAEAIAKKTLSELLEKTKVASDALFKFGATEYRAGNFENASSQFIRSWNIRSQDDPALKTYFPIVVDRLTRGQRSHVAIRHESTPYNLVFSPDGSKFVTSESGKLQVWSSITGQPIGSPILIKARLTLALRFSPTGNEILSASDNAISVWNANDGSKIRDVVANKQFFYVTIDNQLDRIAAIELSDRQTIKIWDLHTGKEVTQARAEEQLFRAQFIQAGSKLWAWGQGLTEYVWDFQAGQLNKPIKWQPKYEVFNPRLHDPKHLNNAQGGMAFSSDEKLLAAWQFQGNIVLWNVATGTIDRELSPEESTNYGVAFSPAGDRCAIYSKNLQMWCYRTGKKIGSPFVHSAYVYLAAFSPEGDKIATASDDNAVRIWDCKTGSVIGNPIQYDDMINNIVFSPDASRVAIQSRNNTTRIWDVYTESTTSLAFAQTGSWMVPLGFSFSEGRKLVATFRSDNAFVYDCRSINLATENQNGFFKLDFKDNDLRFASEDGVVSRWDLESNFPLIASTAEDKPITSIAISQDGRIVATGFDRGARLRHAVTCAPIGATLPHKGYVHYLTFSPDARLLLTAARAFVTKPEVGAVLWDTETGKPVGKPLEHTQTVEFATFSHDGKLVATASEDGTVRIWNVNTCEPVCPPLIHLKRVNTVDFSPSDSQIVTASDDRTARLWDVKTGEAILEPFNHSGAVVRTTFVGSSELLTLSSDNVIYRWDLAQIKPTNAQSFVDANGKSSGALLPSDVDLQAQLKTLIASKRFRYREIAARNAIEGSNWFTAAFHLPWLIENDPHKDYWTRAAVEIFAATKDAELVQVAKTFEPIDDELGGVRPVMEIGADDSEKKTEPLNFDFEEMGLRDWKVNGAAFLNQPIFGDRIKQRRTDMSSQHHGKGWVGTYEVFGDNVIGTLTSRKFVLTQPWASYLIGGGAQPKTRVEVLETSTGEVLSSTSAFDQEEMQRIEVDLSKHVGKTVHIQLIDSADDNWGHINFDDFRLHASQPSLTNSSVVSELGGDQTVAISDLVSQSLKPVTSNSFDSVTKFTELNRPYFENGAMAIRSNGGFWGWEFAKLSVNQVASAKVRVLNNKTGSVGLILTQQTGPGLSIWIDGQAIARTSASLFANEQLKATTPKKSFRGSSVIRPVGEWNELLICRKEQVLTAYINGHKISTFDLGTEPKLDAGLSLGITSYAEGTTVEMGEFSIYPID